MICIPSAYSFGMHEISLLRLLLLLSMTAVSGQVHKQKIDESKKLTYLFLAMIIAALFVCVMYCCKKICPRVDMYTPLELDEIRLERATDREGILAGKIDKMKNKLSNMRKSRTAIETRRDIATNIEDRVDKFNTKGRDIYGEAWEGKNGSIPIRELVKIPDTDVHAMQLEAQAIVTARKEEEKQDLWDLWHKDDIELGSHSQKSVKLSGTQSSRQTDEGRANAVQSQSQTQPESRPRRPSTKHVKESSDGKIKPTIKRVVQPQLSAPPPGVKLPPNKPPPPTTSSLSSPTGVVKRFGSKKFIGDCEDDDSGTDQSAKVSHKTNAKARPKNSGTADTLGTGSDAPMILDRSKVKPTVKVPAHLMKKYPPRPRPGVSAPVSSGPPRPSGRAANVMSNRKPPPPIAPPPGRPPSSAFRNAGGAQPTDRKLK